MNKLEWDLDFLLEGKQPEELMEDALKLLKERINLKNEFYKSKENFKKWDDLAKELTILVHRLMNYISNNLSLDITSERFNGIAQTFQFKYNKLDAELSDLSNIEINNESSIRELLKDEDFKHLRRGYELLFESKKHILSEKEEELMHKLVPLTGGYETVFSNLTNVELGFKPALDSKGKEHKVTISNLSQLLKEEDRTLRENAYKNYYDAFVAKKETLTSTLFNNYKSLNEIAKVRKYDSYIHRALDDDELKNEKVLEAFYTVCAEEKSRSIIKRLNDLRKKAIAKKYNLDETKPWDGNLDIASTKTRYTPEEAQKIAIDSTKIMGDEFNNIIKRSFDENWISWMPGDKKRSGAYSIGGAYGVEKKLIMLNWFGMSEDLTTLLHELGHSIHSELACEAQTYNNANYTIFTAEVASTTTELILSEYLTPKLKGQQKVEALFDWCTRVTATLTRQIAFSKFEYEISTKINNGVPVNPKDVMETYKKISESMIGKSKSTEKEQIDRETITGIRIPHFYAGNFYVYKYAVGITTAITLAEKIKNNPEEGRENFLNYMKAGGSKPPLQIIKDAGVDIEDPETIRGVYKVLEEKINELEKTLIEENML